MKSFLEQAGLAVLPEDLDDLIDHCWEMQDQKLAEYLYGKD